MGGYGDILGMVAPLTLGSISLLATRDSTSSPPGGDDAPDLTLGWVSGCHVLREREGVLIERPSFFPRGFVDNSKLQDVVEEKEVGAYGSVLCSKVLDDVVHALAEDQHQLVLVI